MSGWADSNLGVVFAFMIGACVGSFTNVLIFRSPREGMSSLHPRRSFCPSCRAPISWRDNLPVLSWLLLRGRCRQCKATIGWRYPLVELIVAILFAAAWVVRPPVDADALVVLLVAWYLATLCVAVSLIDFEHLIIPDTITWPGIAVGLVCSVAFPVLHEAHPGFRLEAPHGSSLIAGLFGMVAGGGSLAAVGFLGNIALRKKLDEAGVADAMGWGDVKWMVLAGAFLGAVQVLSAILLGCFAGALVGIAMKVWARVRGEDQPVGLPFGPFLSLGILVELAVPGFAWDLLARIAQPA
jgi:leader peptidase (prepilin peptidase)/N-methyltransferase